MSYLESVFIPSFNVLKNPKIWVYFIPSLLVWSIFKSIAELFDWLFGWMSWFSGDFFSELYFQLQYLTILTFLSPVYGLLSRKLIAQFGEKTTEDSILQFFNDFKRMALLSLVFLAIQFLIIYPLYLVFWLIDLTFISQTIGFLLDALLLGFAFFDYPLEIQGVDTDKSLRFLKRFWYWCLPLGAAFLVVVKIPFIGLVFFPIYFTILATMLYLKLQKS